jgi:type II secretory pathway pseudopilin PulG
MRGHAAISVNALKRIERTIVVVGSTTLAIIIFLLATAGLSFFRQNDAETKLATTKQQIQTLNETIDKAKRVKFKPMSIKELSYVQSTIDRLAKQYDCRLIEVNSTNDESAYASKFKKNSSESGWNQISVQSQMTGTLVNVVSLLRDLTSTSVPLELSTIDITPIEADPQGRPRVSAKVSVQILKQKVTS